MGIAAAGASDVDVRFRVIDSVDPFIGTDVTDLPDPAGLAATWWFPKPQVGNTHPGATAPFGMVSACAYSGAYPTGYGVHDLSTEGVPATVFDRLAASGFTHFQQSGTGAIRKYYNYLRVTPMLSPLDDLGTSWPLRDEVATPGYYATTLDVGQTDDATDGVRCEITVGPKSAIHRYTFPEHHDARIVIDCSLGGLAIEHGTTVPLRAYLHALKPGVAQGEVTVEGAPLAFHIECESAQWRQMLWHDRRLMPGGRRLDFDSIRPTTLRSFGLVYAGPTRPGQVVELRIGFSLRGVEQAAQTLRADTTTGFGQLGVPTFDNRRTATSESWRRQLDKIRVEGASAERSTVFATALYHSVIKPCFALDESPWWRGDGPFVFDICTMWDIYRTQLPLLTAIAPERARDLAHALLVICEEEGNMPVGYRMAKGADRFSRQGSALVHTFLADLCALDMPGIDWDWALCHMETDLRRQYGEEFLERGVAHPVSHTLDLAFGYHCTAGVARRVGDDELSERFEALSTRWENAYDRATGLLIDSTYYEGGRWNYSFRLMHDMAERIEIAGGEARFTELLDAFFGVGAEPVKQLGVRPSSGDVAAGYALDRFEGLNNEPDMDAPWCYHYVGRPDRTTEIVHAAVNHQFAVGRGGLPGNDDSGGLSSWYVWASLGLFPVAGQHLFLVNAPSFERAQVAFGDSVVTISTTGFVQPDRLAPPQYVQSVTFDGRSLDRSWLAATDLHRGGELHIDLGPRPSDWATTTRPPSVGAPTRSDA